MFSKRVCWIFKWQNMNRKERGGKTVLRLSSKNMEWISSANMQRASPLENRRTSQLENRKTSRFLWRTEKQLKLENRRTPLLENQIPSLRFFMKNLKTTVLYIFHVLHVLQTNSMFFNPRLQFSQQSSTKRENELQSTRAADPQNSQSKKAFCRLKVVFHSISWKWE